MLKFWCERTSLDRFHSLYFIVTFLIIRHWDSKHFSILNLVQGSIWDTALHISMKLGLFILTFWNSTISNMAARSWHIIGFVSIMWWEKSRKKVYRPWERFLSHRRLFNGLTVMIDLLVGVFKCCDLSHINAKVTKHKNSWTTKRHE